jgi:hypothetical protein
MSNRPILGTMAPTLGTVNKTRKYIVFQSVAERFADGSRNAANSTDIHRTFCGEYNCFCGE